MAFRAIVQEAVYFNGEFLTMKQVRDNRQTECKPTPRAGPSRAFTATG